MLEHQQFDLVVRLMNCALQLAQHVVGNKAMLEHQQFDLVVRLMNCALQLAQHVVGNKAMLEHQQFDLRQAHNCALQVSSNLDLIYFVTGTMWSEQGHARTPAV
ncbi:hypothetical protein J6590_057034 [Homalodisca vitripennis]|nr:hypothetical protein J6590_057034 [Homalodisca vitripennis]